MRGERAAAQLPVVVEPRRRVVGIRPGREAGVGRECIARPLPHAAAPGEAGARMLPRGVLPLRGARQLPAGPVAVRLGLEGVDVDDGLRGVEWQPPIEPAHLPLLPLVPLVPPRAAPPAFGVAACRSGAPRAGLAEPVGGVVVATGFDEAQVLAGAHRAGIDLEVGKGQVEPVLLVVEAEAVRCGSGADVHAPATHRQRRSGAAARQAHAGRCGVAQGGAQPGQGLAVHVFMEQREAVEVERAVVVGVVVRDGHGRRARIELRGEHAQHLGALRQRRMPTPRMRQQ